MDEAHRERIDKQRFEMACASLFPRLGMQPINEAWRAMQVLPVQMRRDMVTAMINGAMEMVRLEREATHRSRRV